MRLSHPRSPVQSIGRTLAPLILLAATLESSPARGDFFIHFWEPHFERAKGLTLLPEIHNYSASGNFDAEGVRYVPSGSGTYTRLETDVLASYGLTPKLTAYGRVSWAKVTVDNPSFGGDAFGLTDQTLGISFHAWEAGSEGMPVRLDLQAQADLPAYSTSSSVRNDIPTLGAGTTDLSAGAFVTALFSKTLRGAWWFAGGAGYTHRTNELSAAMPWSLSVRYEPNVSGLSLGASALGLQSLKTDPRGQATYVPPNPTVGDGGIFFVDTVNPSYAAVRGEGAYQFSPRISILGTITKMFWGRAVPSSLDIAFGMRMHWDPDTRRRDPVKQSPVQYGKSNQGFVDYAFEARVTRVSDKLGQLKIDKGEQDGVEVGNLLDVFKVKPNGEVGEAIARAKVLSVESHEASLTVVEYFKEVWIEEGFMAKRPLQ
jgi:hypothetical protein